MGKELQSAYTTHCNSAGINPHERLLIVKDPTLVRAGQLTCLNLLSRLPTQHQADFVVRMYARIEEKFNSLFREDLIDAANNKCEWRGVNRIAFIPCFNNYFVVSTSQNKISHAFRCFLDIDLFFESICGGIWGFSFAKSTTSSYFALIARELTKVGTKREGCENKTIFCAHWLFKTGNDVTRSPGSLRVGRGCFFFVPPTFTPSTHAYMKKIF